MLPFENIYTYWDHLLNIFVIAVAFFQLPVFLPRVLSHNYKLLLPFLILSVWVSVCVFVGSPSEDWPVRTSLITIGISFLICSQVHRDDLSRVRYFVLLLAAAFSLYTLLYGQYSLKMILNGSLNTQLGIKLNPANVIIFPRIMYMLVITCIATLIIEKDKWLRIGAALVMIIPILIAFATGNRGTMVALAAAAFILMLSFRTKREIILSGVVIIVLLIISYVIVPELLPLTKQRIISGGRDNSSISRFYMAREALDINNMSLIGRGASADYPHNIFIEFYLNYGIIGLVLFLLVLATSVITARKCYRITGDNEVLWVLSLLTLQMVSQQFSLDIFYGALWAAMVLPLGLRWNPSVPVGNE